MKYCTFSCQVFAIHCAFDAYSTSHCGLVPFQVISSHVRLVASVLDRTAPEE